MAGFRDDDFERLDFKLLQNSAVTLYWRSSYLEEDISWLRSNAYRVHRFETSNWRTEGDMHTAIARELAFPDYYGRNLEALSDSLQDLDIPVEGGTVIVLERFDSFANLYRDVAQEFLDIAQTVSRRYLLRGGRFLILVQSNNPKIEFEVAPAVRAVWNPREWLQANRDLE